MRIQCCPACKCASFLYLLHAYYSGEMANLITVQECEMLESVRIEAFAIMSGVADAVSAWFLPTGSGSAATILVGSSPFFFGCIFHTRKNTVPCSSLLTADCVLALSVDLGFLDLTVVLLHLLNPGSRSNYSVRLLGSVSHTLVLGNKDKRVSKS